MLTQRSVVHKNRRGRILHRITEHYLRDDIYCGSSTCDVCEQSTNGLFPQIIPYDTYPDEKPIVDVLRTELNRISTSQQSQMNDSETPTASNSSLLSQFPSNSIDEFLSIIKNVKSDANIVVIPDLSLFVEQLDIFETNIPPFANVVILQSILQHIQQKYYKIYQKVRAMCNSSVFRSSALLAANFEPKSFSIAQLGSSTSSSSTIAKKTIANSAFHVFCDFFHRQVYSSAMKETQSLTDQIYIPHGVDLHTIHIAGPENSDDESDDTISDDSASPKKQQQQQQQQPKFIIPSSSLVQFEDVIIDDNEQESSHTAQKQSLSSDVSQNQEAMFLEALFIASVKWYIRHTRDEDVVIIGLTNDTNKANQYVQLGLPILPVQLYTSCFYPYHPGLENVVVACAQNADIRNKSKWVFKEHLSTDEIQSGVRRGVLHTGILNIDRDYWTEGSISTEQHGRVLLCGLQNMNRAFEGDTVAVRVWPEERWVAKATALAPEDQPDAILAKNDDIDGTLAAGILDDADTQLEKVDESFIPTVQDESQQQSTKQQQQKTELVPTGEIVGILQRGIRSFCGSIERTDKQDGQVLFLPANRRIPKIFISSKQLQDIVDSRLLVRVDDWSITSHHPTGHITRILGQIGDNEAETEMVLIEHDIKHDRWSTEVEECLPPPDYVIDEQERAGRVDLRGVDICSIDPPGCVDIDDALHCIQLPNGNYEVGVHIADVTHYMQPGSPLDIEAAKRSTSVYLVDRRIDMIPQRLSTNLCSLHEKVERLAFSTVWELNDKAEIIDVKFFKSVILSRAAMSYADAQARIDLCPEHCTTPEITALYNCPLTTACKNLMKLSRLIKARRISQGALTLASTEVKFKMNANRTIAEDLGTYQLKETNSLVEEFMLLANVSVAEKILRHFPGLALLRGHPTPPEEMLVPLVKAAKSWGYNVDITNGKALSDSLDVIVDAGNPMFNKVLRILTTRCMTQAKYLCSGEIGNLKQLHHFGLACNTYTHFTSPIRRYADVLVHRLLATSLGITPLPEAIQDKAHMRDVVENLNLRHKQAQLASRASTDVWVLKYFTGKDIITDAVILSVRSTGVRVIVSEFGIECAVRLVPSQRINDVITIHDSYEDHTSYNPSQIIYNPDLMTLAIYGVEFKVLQNIKVRLCVKENNNRRRWLHVEVVGTLREQLPTDLLQQLEIPGITLQPPQSSTSLQEQQLKLQKTLENDLSEVIVPQNEDDTRPMPADVDDDDEETTKSNAVTSTKNVRKSSIAQTTTEIQSTSTPSQEYPSKRARRAAKK